MVDVDETGKIILNKIKQRVDKEHKKIKRIKTSRGVNPKTNDEEIISAKSIFDVDPEKTSTSSGKRRAIGFIMTSSDEDNEPGKIRVVPRKKNKNQTQSDYDEFSAMGDVSENEEIITNVKPSFIEETGRTQIGRNVDRPMNLDQNRFSKSYFGANFRKVSSLTGKRRASSPIISSSDDNSDSDGVRALPKEDSKYWMRDNHEKSSERIDVNKNEKLSYKIRPNLDEENERLDANRNVRQPINREEYQSSRSYFKTNFGKISSLTVQSKFRDEIVKSSDEENDSDEAIVDQDYDKALKKLNVNEDKKMASSNVTSNVETGKEKFKSKRKIHPLINDEETALSRSSFTANYNKLSSLTVKQKASHPIFTSSDEDKDSNETEVIRKKNVEKSTKIVDVHFERPSLKIKNITARKDRQYDSSVNNEKILFSRPKFNTDLQISIPSTSQNPKTNKTDDLKKLTTLSTKMNTNRLLDYATDEDTEHDDIQIKNSKVFVKENRNIEPILQKNKLQTRLVQYSISSEDSSDNDNDTQDKNLSKIGFDIKEVGIIDKTNNTNNELTKESNNDNNLKDKKQKLQEKNLSIHSLNSFENKINSSLKASRNRKQKITPTNGKSSKIVDDSNDDEVSMEDLKLFKQFLQFNRSNERQLVKSSGHTKQKKIVNTKKEVELIEGSNIMVSEYRLLMITKCNTKKAGQMIRDLFRLVLGEEKLSRMVPLKQKEGRELIPEDISEAIFQYVNANVSKGHEVNVDEFQNIVGSMCCTIRGKFKTKEKEKKD